MSIHKRAVFNCVLYKKLEQTPQWSLNSLHGDETKDFQCFLNHFTSHIKQKAPMSIMGRRANGANFGIS